MAAFHPFLPLGDGVRFRPIPAISFAAGSRPRSLAEFWMPPFEAPLSEGVRDYDQQD